jgi:hypothetical protein
MKKYFTFEVTVLDDKGIRRRFRASNYQVYFHEFYQVTPCIDPDPRKALHLHYAYAIG